MIAGIIVASGRSSRMGYPKALLKMNNEPILARLAKVYNNAVDALYIVAHGEVLRFAESFVRVHAIKGDPQAQMIDSIALAIDALEPDVHAAIIQPVDAPFTSVAMLRALSQNLTKSMPRVLAHKDQPGHPVLIPSRLFEAARGRPQGGLRSLLMNAERLPWPSPLVLADVDTPKDFERWLKEAELEAGSTGDKK